MTLPSITRMILERYPKLDEVVGGSIPDHELSTPHYLTGIYIKRKRKKDSSHVAMHVLCKRRRRRANDFQKSTHRFEKIHEMFPNVTKKSERRQHVPGCT